MTAKHSKQCIVHLFEDTKERENVLSKIEIALDDERNASTKNFSSVGDEMEYGKTYIITLTIEETK